MNQDRHYSAFISYRHHPSDIEVAKHIQQKLEHLIENKDRMEDDVRKTILTFIHLIKEKIIVMMKKSV